MQVLKNIYEVVTQNLKLAHTKISDSNRLVEAKLKEGVLVLMKDHTAKAFQLHYVGNYQVISLRGNQVEICKTEGGDTSWAPVTDVKYILPAENIIKDILDYQNFGRKNHFKAKPG